MVELSEIGLIVLAAFFNALFHPIFWIVCFLVLFQYRRISQTEEKLFGCPYNNVWKQVIISLCLGAGGGFLASAILILLGLSLDRIGILFLWPVAILLLLVHPRFLCFAYAGGIVAVASLFARNVMIPVFPRLEEINTISALINIHLPGLLVLIAVLHLTESLLIYIGGHWGNSPVYLKNKAGELVGGFTLQRFWPLPLVGMVALLQPDTASLITDSVPMPEWWPILKPGLEPLASETIIYILLPVVAGLGYADLALSSTPRQKSITTARYLFVYSIGLLALALASEFNFLFVLPGVMFAPLGHEMVVYLGNRLELSRPLRYRRPGDTGVMVLAVYPGSTAHKAGLQEADVITTVNNQHVENANHFWLLLKESYFMVHLAVERDGRFLTLVMKMRHADRPPNLIVPGERTRRQPSLGLILVPDSQTLVYMEQKQDSLLKRIKEFFLRMR